MSIKDFPQEAPEQKEKWERLINMAIEEGSRREFVFPTYSMGCHVATPKCSICGEDHPNHLPDKTKKRSVIYEKFDSKAFDDAMEKLLKPCTICGEPYCKHLYPDYPKTTQPYNRVNASCWSGNDEDFYWVGPIYQLEPRVRYILSKTEKKITDILDELDARLAATKFYGPDPMAFIPYRLRLAMVERGGERVPIKEEKLISFSESREERFKKAHQIWEEEIEPYVTPQIVKRTEEVLLVAREVLAQIKELKNSPLK